MWVGDGCEADTGNYEAVRLNWSSTSLREHRTHGTSYRYRTVRYRQLPPEPTSPSPVARAGSTYVLCTFARKRSQSSWCWYSTLRSNVALLRQLAQSRRVQSQQVQQGPRTENRGPRTTERSSISVHNLNVHFRWPYLADKPSPPTSQPAHRPVVPADQPSFVLQPCHPPQSPSFDGFSSSGISTK